MNGSNDLRGSSSASSTFRSRLQQRSEAMNEPSIGNDGNVDNQGSSRSLMASESHHSHNSYSLGDMIFPRSRPAIHLLDPPTTPPLRGKKSSRFARSLSESLPSLPMFSTMAKGVVDKDCTSHEDASTDKHQSSLSSLSDSPTKQPRKGHVRFEESAFRRMSMGKSATLVLGDDSFASLNLELDVPADCSRDGIPMSPLNMNSPWIRPKTVKSSRDLINSLDLVALEGGGSDEFPGPNTPVDSDFGVGKGKGNLISDDESVAGASASTNREDDGDDTGGGGESSSSQDGEGVTTTAKASGEEDDGLSSAVRQETFMIRAVRVVYYTVLMSVAACAVALTYSNSSSSEAAFRDQFDNIATQLISNLLRETESKALLAFATASFITELMAVGNASPTNLTFSLSSVAGAQLAASNAASYSWGPLLRTRSELEDFERLVKSEMFRVDISGGRLMDDTPKPPFLPIRYGLSETQNVTLYNQLSDNQRSKPIQEMIMTERQATSELFVREGGIYDLVGGIGEPGFIMSTPVFSGRDGVGIAGAVVSEYLWRTFLRNASNPSFSDLVDIVIENSCSGAFTFRLNYGGELVLVASEDVHEERFEALHQTSLYSDMDQMLQPPIAETSSTAVACRYRYMVHATSDLEAQFPTNNPSLTAAVTFVLFLVIAVLSAACDYFVAKRHGKVFEAAKRSTKIVSSLFPKSFRGRLYNEAADGGSICTRGASSTAGKSAAGSWKGGGAGGDSSTVPCTNSTVSGYSTTKRLRSMDHQRSLLRSFLEASPGAETSDMEAIADFYPEATVMMLDIQGFTAWSSEREPAMVFKLLETIFRSFDEATRRFGVFKIETIGDSYVCVTGVPDPKDDHAVAMTRFAFECLQRFNRLTKQLETQLGPSTGDLQARIGIHSGSVTAGVIRGERARFQLFGDTMNTASRMESNGLPGQIQVSEATAQLLRQAGKERWLCARKELVDAKGKGKMQTYWVSPSRKSRRTGQATSSSDGNSDAGESMYCQDIHLDSSSLDPNNDSIDFQIREASRVGKRMRLVDWNVEILAGFLRKVIASRDPASGRPRLARGGSKASVFTLDAEARSLGVSRGGSVLDEVTEVIEMPRFDMRQTRRIAESDHAELDSVVKGQLREYVMRISSMYRDLDFHDFEHASHVTMSASKLLGRLAKRSSGDDDRHGDSEREIHNATFGISSDPLLQFAIVFASLIHDVDHTGLTNAQLVQQKAPTAILYKNRSVSQQNSFDVAWAVLMDSDFDQLRGSIYGNSRVEFRRFRQLLIHCVLATDVSDPATTAARQAKWQRAFDGGGGDDLKATVVLEAIAQAADVAHAMQHWITFCKWSERELKERCSSGNGGRGIDSMLRTNSIGEPDATRHWYGYQLRMLDDHVIPLAHKLNDSGVFGPNSRELLCWAVENRREWEQHGPSIVDRMTLMQHQQLQQQNEVQQRSPTQAKRSKAVRRRSSCSGVSSGARSGVSSEDRTYTSHSSN